MNEPQARLIWRSIAASRLEAEKQHVARLAVRYAQFRVEWRLATREERAAMDGHRTHLHTALIDACNILSRRMRECAEDNEWRSLVGEDRREIGDFACWLHCFLGLEAR